MMLVDFREDEKAKGSPGLWQDLQRTRLPLKKWHLDAGDLMFKGRGPQGDVTVGLEFKKLRDLLSSIRTGRMQEQIERMQDYDFRYLLVEGEWRTDDRGLVAVRAGRGVWKAVPGAFHASELDQTLLGFALRAGVFVWPTTTRKDSIRWIQSLYHNFCDRPWEAHGSHTATHQKPATLLPLSGFRTFIMGVPGIGVKTSRAVEEYFCGSPRTAVTASVDEWKEIDGIGAKGAEKIVSFLD